MEIPLTVVAGMLGFAWIAVQDTIDLSLFSVVYGFFAGAITTITAVVDAALCPALYVLPWKTNWRVFLSFSSGWLGLQLFTVSMPFAATILAIRVRSTKYGGHCWEKS